MHFLIFDFDGVLGDTYNVWTEVQNQQNKQNGKVGAFIDLNVYAIQKPHHARNHTLTQADLAVLHERISNGGKLVHEKGFPLFNEFILQIKRLTNTKMAVVSSGSQNYVKPAIEKMGLDFTHILAFEDHHSKEEKVEQICQDWGIEFSEAYYFTDTLADIYELKDIINPHKLIGVTWGYCSKEQLLTELPNENILNSPVDLVQVLYR